MQIGPDLGTPTQAVDAWCRTTSMALASCFDLEVSSHIAIMSKYLPDIFNLLGMQHFWSAMGHNTEQSFRRRRSFR